MKLNKTQKSSSRLIVRFDVQHTYPIIARYFVFLSMNINCHRGGNKDKFLIFNNINALQNLLHYSNIPTQ